MIRSRLSSKLFASAVTVFAALTLAIYAFSVPLIKDTAFDLEERAGRAVLDTVYELANRIHLDLESHRELTLEAHRQRLKSMVDLAQQLHRFGSPAGQGRPAQHRGRAATAVRQPA